jgi:hypothetical protein
MDPELILQVGTNGPCQIGEVTRRAGGEVHGFSGFENLGVTAHSPEDGVAELAGFFGCLLGGELHLAGERLAGGDFRTVDVERGPVDKREGDAEVEDGEPPVGHGFVKFLNAVELVGAQECGFLGGREERGRGVWRMVRRTLIHGISRRRLERRRVGGERGGAFHPGGAAPDGAGFHWEAETLGTR